VKKLSSPKAIITSITDTAPPIFVEKFGLPEILIPAGVPKKSIDFRKDILEMQLLFKRENIKI
jgi:hypothetical protein